MQSNIISRLETLKTLFETGEIPQLHQHVVLPEIESGSRENYLYLIMTCALNFQRSSPKTWESALATWNDEETRFVFFPELVVKTDVEKLRVALLKHRLALQPNKHVQIWQKLSQIFEKYYQADPRQLLKSGDFEVEKILNIIQKEKKREFPYLSGPKLSNYSLFILLNYSDLKLKNTKSISIIPDTHIMQATVQLGILPINKITPEAVAFAWDQLLKDTQYSPIDFHSILWNWSRNNFQPAV